MIRNFAYIRIIIDKEKSKVSLFITAKKEKIIYTILARRLLSFDIKSNNIKIESDSNYFKYKEKDY